jgi:hypothetical protein
MRPAIFRCRMPEAYCDFGIAGTFSTVAIFFPVKLLRYLSPPMMVLCSA